MNKSVYLGLSVLKLSKTIMYEFLYDYVKPKYAEKVELCYMDTNSFFVYIKHYDIYKDITGNAETRWVFMSYKLWVGMTTTKSKEQNLYWFNEGLVRKKNHEQIFRIENKNL